MASLLDIAPSTRTVTIRGVDVDVVGISALGLAALLRRPEFAPIKKALSDGDESALSGFSFETVLDLGPVAIGAAIAAGLGKPGDRSFEEKAQSLTLGEQGELLMAIFEETFPEGFTRRAAPLFAKAMSLVRSKAAAVKAV